MSGLVSLHKRIHHYLEERFAPPVDEIEAARRRSHEAGLPHIEVPPLVGKLLEMLTRLHRPKRILEIGTLGGVSALHLLRAAPEATLLTLEREPTHAAVARENLAPYTDRVEIVVGDALEQLPKLTDRFDLIFLDGDKEHYPDYLDLLVPLLKQPGGLLLADNVLRRGRVLQPASTDRQMVGLHKALEKARNKWVEEVTVIPTFGGPGGGSLDGLLMLLT